MPLYFYFFLQLIKFQNILVVNTGSSFESTQLGQPNTTKINTTIFVSCRRWINTVYIRNHNIIFWRNLPILLIFLIW